MRVTGECERMLVARVSACVLNLPKPPIVFAPVHSCSAVLRAVLAEGRQG